MRKKINLDEIDESFIIASVKKDKSSIPENPERLLNPAQAIPVEQLTESNVEAEQLPVPVEQPKEDTRTKKAKQQEYESFFVREPDMPPSRFGKSINIRKEYHDRISQIISVIGNKEVSLVGYVDNILTHHFDNFSDDITLSFKKNLIFK